MAIKPRTASPIMTHMLGSCNAGSSGENRRSGGMMVDGPDVEETDGNGADDGIAAAGFEAGEIGAEMAGDADAMGMPAGASPCG